MLGNMLREAIKYSLPDIDINEDQMNYLAQLCAMSTVPTGEEDIKSLVRPLSDIIINSVVATSKNVTNPILTRLVKIFCIEWCFRHGHLKEDWIWEWKNPREGQLHYLLARPIEEIEGLPAL